MAKDAAHMKMPRVAQTIRRTDQVGPHVLIVGYTEQFVKVQ